MDSNIAMADEVVRPMFTVDSYSNVEYINVTVENVIDITPLQLAKWIVTDVLSMRIPTTGLNQTIHIENDLLPLLPVIANRIATMTELFVVVVGATPTQTHIRTSGGTDTKAASESLSRKKDELYRALQTLESMRETVSRMMTGISSIDKLSGRFAGM